MNFEPQKFFVGLIDFFAILMPGALLTYLTKDWAAARLGLGPAFPLGDAEAATVFLFASYLLGHMASLLGAALDEWIYDPLRKCTDLGQISRLAKGRRLARPWLRRFAKSDWLFGKSADAAVTQAVRLKSRQLHLLSAGSAVNAFQWCRARLSKEHPEGLSDVQRFEANSKFFRSFVIVLAALALFYAARADWLKAAICLASVAPALWRYIDQRFKATQQAYWFVLTLEAMKGAQQVNPPREDGLTHAGGVAFRTSPGEPTKFLMLQASKDRSQWVLPKGHIEPGEEPRTTAVRELLEETGHFARNVEHLQDSPLNKSKDAPMVRWFLMELDEEGKDWPKENRQSEFLFLDDARKRAAFVETRALLEMAEKRLPKKSAA